MKKLLFVSVISLFVLSCTNTNTNPQTSVASASPAGPKRLSVKQAENGVTEMITLAPGASMQFVTGATGAQNIYVTPRTKGLSFTMLKGMCDSFVLGDDGTYSAETKGNNAQTGDILFEVKNNTAKEIKTSIRIQVEDFGC